MKKVSKKVIIQYIIFYAIAIWGTLSFIVLAGDDNPDNPISFEKFILYKVLAAISLYTCYLIGILMSKKGLLPEFKEEE